MIDEPSKIKSIADMPPADASTIRGRRIDAGCLGCLGVLGIIVALLSWPNIRTVTSADGSLTARAASPGFLPYMVGALVDANQPREILMPHLRFRVSVHDNQTGETTMLIDEPESTDF